LVSLELLKIIQPSLPLSSFKNTFLNLALPLYAMSEPAPPAKIKITGNVFYTVWDNWEFRQPEVTLQQFTDHFSAKFKLTVTAVFNGHKSIYVSLLPMHKKRLSQKLQTLLGQDVAGKECVDMTVTFADEEGNDVEAPTVRFYLQ